MIRPGMAPDFYGVLGVPADASQEAVDRAYAVAKAKPRQDAAALRAIEVAYGVLRDPVKRKAYDRIRSREGSAPRPAQKVQPPPQPAPPRPANALLRLWRGEFSPGLIFLLLVVLPFGVSFLLPAGPFWSKLLLSVWFLAAAVLLWRSAFNVQRRFWGYLTRAFVVLMFLYQAIAIPAAWYVDRFQLGTLARSGFSGEQAEGCVNAEAVILRAVAGGRKARPEEAEFQKSPEGRYLDAALAGKTSEVKRLLDQGVDIAARDKRRAFWDNSALDHAARTDNVPLAQLLLARGFDVNARSKAGHTALHVATGIGRGKMVEFLLKNGADTGVRDSRAGTPLEVAVVQARPSMARVLVKHGAHTGGDGRASPLIAIRNVASLCNGHSEVIKLLGADGAALFARDERGDTAARAIVSRGDDTAMVLAREFPALDWNTPVTWGKHQVPLLMAAACAPRSHETVQYLLTAHPQRERWRAAVSGPWGSLLHCATQIKPGHWSETAWGLITDVNIRDAGGMTPLHRAHEPSFIDALIARGADVNARDADGETALMKQVHREEAARLLIERGADPGIRDAKGQTLLHRVASANRLGLARLLIERKVELDVVDAAGFPALAFARSRDMAQLLIDAGASTGPVGPERKSALHAAASKGNAEVVRVLVEKGADPLARAADGTTPFHAAVRDAGGNAMKALLAANPKGVHAQDKDGRSPLHHASELGYPFVIKALIEQGARTNLADRLGNTPLHLTVLRGNVRTAALLVALGADPRARNKEGKSSFDLAAQSTRSDDLLSALRGESGERPRR